MNGFLVVQPRPQSLLQRLTGGKPPQDVFVEIESLIARKPFKDLAGWRVINILSDHQIPREAAVPMLTVLYAPFLRYSDQRAGNAMPADKGVPRRRLRRPGVTSRSSGTTKTTVAIDRGLAGRLHDRATTTCDFSYVYGSRPFTPTSDRETACVAR